MFTGNAVLVVLFTIYIRSAWSIHCLDCNSHNNSMCLDPTSYDRATIMKFVPITKCGAGVVATGAHKFFCRKIVQTILHKGYEPEVRVTRGCGWIRHHKDCYNADNEDHQETVCQCFKDGCNGAGAHTLSLALLGTAALLGVKMI